MSALLAFMLMVSCSDGYKDCAAAETGRPFASAAACEAELDKNLRRFYAAGGGQKETVLARCVSGAGGSAAAAGGGLYGTIFWQVSTSGDLLASMQSGQEPAAARRRDGRESPLYAENIAAEGAQAVNGSPALLAAAAAAGKAARGPLPGRAMAFYGKYSGKSRAETQARAQKTAVVLAGYSPKYIYETANFGQAYYVNASMNIIWGQAAGLSAAAFEIEKPKERIYAMPEQELSALRVAPPPAASALPAAAPLRQGVFFGAAAEDSAANGSASVPGAANGSAAAPNDADYARFTPRLTA